MKAAAFEYVRAQSVADAVSLLVKLGEGARLIAGGQSLVPALNMRLNAPTHLIDIGRLGELRGIARAGNGIRIGANTSQAELLRSDLISRHAPLIAHAAQYIAHPAIRNRGTIGGNLAHADPASELPACMVALEAAIVAAGPKGERNIPAAQFFTGLYSTALKANEILTAIEIPQRAANEACHFAELSRRCGDFAIVGLACVARISRDRFEDIRPVFFGAGDKPALAEKTRAQILNAARGAPEDFREALGRDLSPHNDLEASAETRLHLAHVLLRRCLKEL
ncbi:MAG TPA: xanthine dehydrogenase family protein subunit M, partial [Hyphomicrobiales bacterium]|nr:xanthine dehydrogenase family protein subunit M [Hyphomicrobiales bacterium]